MLPCYEPLDRDSLLIGMQWVRGRGEWPVLRHVFECEKEAGLIVDVDPLGDVQTYGVSYAFSPDGVSERLHPL